MAKTQNEKHVIGGVLVVLCGLFAALAGLLSHSSSISVRALAIAVGVGAIFFGIFLALRGGK